MNVYVSGRPLRFGLLEEDEGDLCRDLREEVRPIVLFAGDDEATSDWLTTALIESGYDVVPVRDSKQLPRFFARYAGSAALNRPPDAVLLQLQRPTPDALQPVQWLRGVDWQTPVVLLGAPEVDEEPDLLSEARRLGVEVVNPPCTVERLLARLRAVVLYT